MAEKNKKKKYPNVGFYEEPDFVSLTSSLRKISGDDTIPTDKYVGIYKDLYDLITPENTNANSGVVDIKLSNDNKNLIISYANNTSKELSLDENDEYLYKVFYDTKSNLIYFILKSGEKLTLDVNLLVEQFATKEELKTELTNIKNEVNILIEQKFEEESRDIEWLNF